MYCYFVVKKWGLVNFYRKLLTVGDNIIGTWSHLLFLKIYPFSKHLGLNTLIF